MGDHTESVQIEYDPSVISYRALLDVFWDGHNPAAASYSRQYMAAVFYHNDEQEALAIQTRDELDDSLAGKVQTTIAPAGTFYPAEDYHQKYNLRRKKAIADELQAIYPQVKDLVASTAATRINGYLGGYGSRAQLESELGSLGLSPSAREDLVRAVRR